VPLQARGGGGRRHFDKYIFQAPIPLYDPSVDLHLQLVELAETAEAVAAAVQLPEGKTFPAWRGMIRDALARDSVGEQIEQAVSALLGHE